MELNKVSIMEIMAMEIIKAMEIIIKYLSSIIRIIIINIRMAMIEKVIILKILIKKDKENGRLQKLNIDTFRISRKKYNKKHFKEV